MKRLFIVFLALGMVGCTTQQGGEITMTPESTQKPEETEVVVEPSESDFKESKIDIDLYKVDEYYPVVDGVVTYPDGSTEEFTNSAYLDIDVDANGENDVYLYETRFSQDTIERFTKEPDCYSPDCYRLVLVNENLPVWVYETLPEGFSFEESTNKDAGIIDGVFGIDFENKSGDKIPYVVYRYSNYIPKGYEINESFRISTDKTSYYLWRIKDYDNINEFNEMEWVTIPGATQRQYIIHWYIESGMGFEVYDPAWK